MHNEPTIGRRVSYMSDGGFSGSARCWIRGSQPGVHVPLWGYICLSEGVHLFYSRNKL